MTTTAERLAESVYAKLVFRYGTPALLVIAIWLGGQYVDGIQNSISDMQEITEHLKERVQSIEDTSAIVRKGRDDFQATVVGRLEKLDDKVDTLSNGVAGLSGKVDTLIDQKHAEIVPPGMR